MTLVDAYWERDGPIVMCITKGVCGLLAATLGCDGILNGETSACVGNVNAVSIADSIG